MRENWQVTAAFLGRTLERVALEKEQLQAENERLRETLREIAEGFDDGRNPGLSIVRQKARDALDALASAQRTTGGTP